MELLNQMDGFDVLGKVKMIMATNRPDTLDPALLRPGRLDRKIEIPLPNEQVGDQVQISRSFITIEIFLRPEWRFLRSTPTPSPSMETSIMR